MSTQYKMNSVTTGQAQNIMNAMILHALRQGRTPDNICLHGSPGIGKSAIVAQLPTFIKSEFGEETKVVIIDLRLSGMAESDLLGIPYVCKETGEMKFSTPEWFPKDDDTIYILLFDELMNAHKSVVHAAYRLLLDRSIHSGKKLPKSTIVIAAGNLVSDKTGAVPLLPAAANRFAVHLLLNKYRGALDHFTEVGVRPEIVSFLEFDGDFIFSPPKGDEVGFPTPRSWVNGVNQLLNNPTLMNDKELLRITIAGAVGDTAATAFMAHLEYNSLLPAWDLVRAGDTKYTYDIDRSNAGVVAAVGVSLGYQIIETLVEGKYNETDNLCSIIGDQLPTEVLVVTIRTLKRQPKALARIPKSKELSKLFQRVKNSIS